MKKISFVIAFLAGITTILSPCILPLIPAFFAYAFKEKKQITKMTLVFFFGFTPVFIFLGVIVTSVGILFAKIFRNLDIYISIAGILLIFLGAFYFFGFGFRLLPYTPKTPKKNIWGVFVFGLLFGFGWVLCIGPILSGVLIAASVFQNYVTTTFLMISYSLGVFTPLFILSFFYDKYDLGNSKIMKGKDITLLGKKFHTNNMIAGSLLIITGIVFLFFKGTGIVNGFQMFGLRQWFYSLQDFMIENTLIANGAGTLILVLVIYGVYHFVKKNKDS